MTTDIEEYQFDKKNECMMYVSGFEGNSCLEAVQVKISGQFLVQVKICLKPNSHLEASTK